MCAIEGDFAICLSLYHGLELMEQHGLRSVFNFLQDVLSTEKPYNRTRTELLQNHSFCQVFQELTQDYSKPLRYVFLLIYLYFSMFPSLFIMGNLFTMILV